MLLLNTLSICFCEEMRKISIFLFKIVLLGNMNNKVTLYIDNKMISVLTFSMLGKIQQTTFSIFFFFRKSGLTFHACMEYQVLFSGNNKKTKVLICHLLNFPSVIKVTAHSRIEDDVIKVNKTVPSQCQSVVCCPGFTFSNGTCEIGMIPSINIQTNLSEQTVK